MKLLAVCAILLPTLLVNAHDLMENCKWPSEFWCTDAKIAEACGVSLHCRMIDAINTQYASRTSGDAPLVDFGLYIESLCPDCRQFITQQFMPTWNQISSIMNVTIVPYGNAREQYVSGHWQYTCQHGSQECLGNVIETCALHLYKFNTVVQFIGCIEASNVSPIDQTAKKCATSYPELNFDRIMQCANSQEGELLEHQMALVTDSLVPKHTYVPWVTLNGVHTEEIQQKAQDDLLGLICTTYQGTKPDACTKRTFSSSARDFVNRPNTL